MPPVELAQVGPDIRKLGPVPVHRLFKRIRFSLTLPVGDRELDRDQPVPETCIKIRDKVGRRDDRCEGIERLHPEG